MKKRLRHSSILGAVCALIVLSLMTGCYRPAAPDVTATPAAAAEEAPSDEEMMATAAAESTRAAEMAEETPAPEAPTVPPPTPTPTPTTTPEPAAPEATTPAPTAPAPSPTSPPPSGQVKHTVKRGENLFRIALRYGTTVQAIASANRIANPARIYVGQVLVIPSSGGQPSPPATGGTTYVVKRGDNLFRIALRYNISYLYLAQYNGITNPSQIYVGQVLRIP